MPIPPPNVLPAELATLSAAVLPVMVEFVNVVAIAPPEYIPPPIAPTPAIPDEAVFPLTAVFVMLNDPVEPPPSVMPPPRAAVPVTADPALLPEIVALLIVTLELVGASTETPPPRDTLVLPLMTRLSSVITSLSPWPILIPAPVKLALAALPPPSL